MYVMWIRKLLFICLFLFSTDSYADKAVNDSDGISCISQIVNMR